MLKGTILLFMGQFVAVGCNLVLHAFLGRSLGPKSYGIFGIINSLILLNEMLFLKAISEGTSKFVAENSGAVRSIINIALRFQFVLGIIVGGLFFFFSEWITNILSDPSMNDYIKLISFLFPISAISFTYIGALNGMRSFDRQSNVWIIFSLMRLFSVVIFVSLGFEIIGVIIGFIISSLVQLIAAQKYCRPFVNIGDINIKKFTGFLPQLILISFFSAIIMNIDILAIKSILMDNRLTGLYSSAITITRVPVVFLAPLALTLFPSIAKAIAEKDMMNINILINQSLKYLLVIITPIVFLVAATPRELISFIFGVPYSDASPVLKILIFGTLLFTVKVLMYNIIVAGGKPRIVIFIGIISLLIDILLIFYLIKRFNIVGAAWATSTTHLVGFILSLSYIYYRYKTLIRIPTLLRVISSSVIIFFIASILPHHGKLLLLNYLTSIFLYLALLFIMKEFNLDDLQAILSIFKERFLFLRSKNPP